MRDRIEMENDPKRREMVRQVISELLMPTTNQVEGALAAALKERAEYGDKVTSRIGELEAERDAAMAEVARLREAERWIPVGERLPEAEGFYLCVIDYHDGAPYITPRIFTRHKKFNIGFVTHWRSMPELPTESK